MGVIGKHVKEVVYKPANAPMPEPKPARDRRPSPKPTRKPVPQPG